MTSLDTRPARRVEIPSADILEADWGWLILMDLPGVANDGLHVELDRGELHVRGARTLPGQDAPSLYERTFTLPEGVDADGIQANLADGVLRVEVPRPDELRPRRIEVHAA